MPTVYATAAPERFFLLPEDHKLPSGGLQLRSLTGDQIKVDAEAVQRYAISEDDAKKYVREQVSGIAKRTKGFLAGAGQVMRHLAQATREAQEAEGLSAKQREGLESAAKKAIRAETRQAAARQRLEEREATIADALGVDKSVLKEDPLALLTGLQSFLEDLSTNLKVFVDPDADRELVARRLKVLNDAIVANGGSGLPDDAAESAEAFRDWLGDPARIDVLREATQELLDDAARMRAERS